MGLSLMFQSRVTEEEMQFYVQIELLLTYKAPDVVMEKGKLKDFITILLYCTDKWSYFTL